jgi:hypothetical protein
MPEPIEVSVIQVAGGGDMHCDRCVNPQTIREAALRPEAAAEYPFLPVRMWTGAARVAQLVASYRGIPREMVERLHRLLSDQDFVFRGG